MIERKDFMMTQIITEKEMKFIHNILNGLSPTNAAKEAGYSPGSTQVLVRRLAQRWMVDQREAEGING